MGKEKNVSAYTSAYDTQRNECTSHKSFSVRKTEQFKLQREYEKQQEQIKMGMNPPSEPLDKPARHSLSYYTKDFMNSEGLAKMTRRPESMDKDRKKKEFLKYVKEYEEVYETPLSEHHKGKIRSQMLEHAEKHSGYLYLTDDALQFSIRKIGLCNLARIYLYKVFFPRIFDFKKTDESIIFASSYIEDNFDNIFLLMDKLFTAIVFDGALSCVIKACTQELRSYVSHTDTVTNSADLSDFMEEYHPRLKADEKPSKKKLIEIMLPSTAFISRMFYNINQEDSVIRMTTLFSKRLFYRGKRVDDARLKLENTVRTHKMVFNKKYLFDDSPLYENKPFTRLMNAAFVNYCTGIYDLDIMQNNSQFKPYLIDGFLTKFVVNEMIRKNGEHLKYNGKGLDLSTPQANPNCIIRNITGRDYEVLSEILDSVRTTIEKYYFTEILGEKKDKLISVKPLLERIHHFNAQTITGDMNDLVPDITLENVDISSYERVTEAYFTKNECAL